MIPTAYCYLFVPNSLLPEGFYRWVSCVWPLKFLLPHLTRTMAISTKWWWYRDGLLLKCPPSCHYTALKLLIFFTDLLNVPGEISVRALNVPIDLNSPEQPHLGPPPGARSPFKLILRVLRPFLGNVVGLLVSVEATAMSLPHHGPCQPRPWPVDKPPDLKPASSLGSQPWAGFWLKLAIVFVLSSLR